ncbi:hypothetical protein Syun_014740 [Stephania yunnanensis]|uniref:Uncharacterized protein n=1 Tax=Stephania yunnanensis TaxID=152371 RepID=A0AAP0JKS1_9MAGN
MKDCKRRGGQGDKREYQSPTFVAAKNCSATASTSALFDNTTTVIEYQSPSLTTAKNLLHQRPSGGGHRRRERSIEWWRVSSATVAAGAAKRPRRVSDESWFSRNTSSRLGINEEMKMKVQAAICNFNVSFLYGYFLLHYVLSSMHLYRFPWSSWDSINVGVGDGLKEKNLIGSGGDCELRAKRGDEVEGGDGLKEKEKEVASLKEKEKEGWLDGRRRRSLYEAIRLGFLLFGFAATYNFQFCSLCTPSSLTMPNKRKVYLTLSKSV